MKRETLKSLASPVAATVFVVIATWACTDPRTGPVARAIPPVAAAQVSPEWSVASANVVVTQELIDEENGRTLSRAPRYRYAVSETRESAGWRAVVVKLAPQPGDISDKLRRPPSGRNLARVEFDGATGASKAFSADGNEFPRSRADSAAFAAALARNSRRPSWYDAKPRPPLPVRTGEAARRSLIAGLIVQSDPTHALRDALTRRFGMPSQDSNGDQLFRLQAGDTVRTVAYRPSVAAVASIRVEIAGKLASRTEYEFATIGDGIVARTQVRTVWGAGTRTESARTRATTVTWSDLRIAR